MRDRASLVVSLGIAIVVSCALNACETSAGPKATPKPTHDWRRLKTATSHRSVPLWPQLREILKAYFPRREREGGALLFPSFRTGKEAMVTDFRKVLDAIAGRAGWAPGEIRSKMFRHTYCAARLQTLDQGAAVSPFTVARETRPVGPRTELTSVPIVV